MAAGEGSAAKAILFAFGANLGIAICKGAAALHTGSSAMLAETIHSCADTGNQVLLMLGLYRAKRPPDAEHPLGYGKLTYFWSFMVAVLLFSVGGLFSIYEGWHKFTAAEPVAHAWVAFLVLGVSMVLEAFSLYGCLREVNKVRGGRTLWQWVNTTRSSELVVVFGEDLAALLGLALAFGFLLLAVATNEPRYDAHGSISIGVLLVIIAVFLGVRVQALLIGRSADPDLVSEVERLIAKEPDIEKVFNVITVQMGPKAMLAAKIKLRGEMRVSDACKTINRLEKRLQKRFPEIGWCFVEPDITD